MELQMKNMDGLILLKHNGATAGGIFDTDNYNHNTLSQASILELQAGDMVFITSYLLAFDNFSAIG